MQVVCVKCNHVLEYSSARPSFCAYCGQALGPAPKLETTALLDPEAATLSPTERAEGETAAAPEQVGAYRLIRSLGSGAMGTVYEAEDSATGRRVALKLIAPEYAASRESVDRFRLEGRLASAIAHPRCVFVLAADEDAGRPYIAMELMPGRTLSDLVRDQGPLPVEQAITKILDVVEGLEEAHRLGLVHRDVKPSNCFLEADSRVKIGDFGLTKSLLSDSHLTKTGTFLGTPLYSAPEQIRLEQVDQQADVYSVSATLYFLLTGQAPFQTGDTMATMARIVADDPPSMRILRPEIPAALDKVVLRGLERDRGRRWQSLEEFRRALLRFLPGQLLAGSLGWRFAASVVDFVLLWFVEAILNGGVVLLRLGNLSAMFDQEAARKAAADPVIQSLALFNALTAVLYYAVMEGVWGWSVGKRLMRLQVCGLDASGPPGLWRAVLRAGVFYCLFNLDAPAFWIIRLVGLVPQLNPEEFQIDLMKDPLRFVPQMLLLFALGVTLWIGGKALLVGTMRKRNGYRGLHEFASGTRVLRMSVWEKRRSLWSRRPHVDVPPPQRPAGVPERIGPYAVGEVIWSMADEEVLLAEDPGLQRRIWVWRRPGVLPAFSAARREVGRMGRLRWLACGVDGDSQWDAFLAPTGFPLIELIQTEGRLSWPEARPVLAELTEELTAATEDQTLPRALAFDQVWVQSNERVLLLDGPFTSPAEVLPSNPRAGVGESRSFRTRGTDVAEVVPVDQTDSERGLDFLRRMAMLVLEGRPRSTDSWRGPVQAPMPGAAARAFDRLLNRGRPYSSVHDFKAALDGIREQPAEVTSSRRLWHLTIQTALLFTGLFCCMPTISVVTSPNFFTVQGLDNMITVNEIAREDLQSGATAELIAGSLSPDPWARLTAVADWAADQQLQKELQENWQVMTRERDDRLPELSWFWRLSRSAQEDLAPQQTKMQTQKGFIRRVIHEKTHFRIVARDARSMRALREREADVVGVYRLVLLVVWPCVWLIWAFAARGGLGYRVAGIALVRADGRPASRLQCLWRAFLVWMPFTVLFLLSSALDGWYWSLWHVPEQREAYRWLASVSSVCWYAAFLLLAGYVILALRSPTRSLHDRVAGIYLVPR